jgi:hypothetical protein
MKGDEMRSSRSLFTSAERKKNSAESKMIFSAALRENENLSGLKGIDHPSLYRGLTVY